MQLLHILYRNEERDLVLILHRLNFVQVPKILLVKRLWLKEGRNHYILILNCREVLPCVLFHLIQRVVRLQHKCHDVSAVPFLMKFQKLISDVIFLQCLEAACAEPIQGVFLMRDVLNQLIESPEIALKIVLIFRVNSVDFSVD